MGHTDQVITTSHAAKGNVERDLVDSLEAARDAVRAVAPPSAGGKVAGAAARACAALDAALAHSRPNKNGLPKKPRKRQRPQGDGE